jgi:hypothetical protein
MNRIKAAIRLSRSFGAASSGLWACVSVVEERRATPRGPTPPVPGDSTLRWLSSDAQRRVGPRRRFRAIRRIGRPCRWGAKPILRVPKYKSSMDRSDSAGLGADLAVFGVVWSCLPPYVTCAPGRAAANETRGGTHGDSGHFGPRIRLFEPGGTSEHRRPGTVVCTVLNHARRELIELKVSATSGQISRKANRTGSVHAAFDFRDAQVRFRSPPARPTDSSNRPEPAAWAHAALRVATQPPRTTSRG